MRTQQSVPIGTGFFLQSSYLGNIYGIVLNQEDENTINFCLVQSVYDGMGNRVSCYDDENAKYDLHKDNVCLRHCPPPFSELCESVAGIDNKAYAIADLSNLQPYSLDTFLKNARILDNGALVPDEDMKKIWKHEFPRQPEKEKVYKDRSHCMDDYFSNGTSVDFDLFKK